MKRLVILLILILGTVSDVFGQETVDLNISGWWKGSTNCPLGAVFYAIKMDKDTGTVTHDGYGPSKKYPLEVKVKVSFTKGWEGIWARFVPLDPNYDGSFEYLSALVSADQRTMTIRPRHGIGDCSGFRLTKSELPSTSSSSKPASALGPPESREPTQSEMLAAFETALHGSASSLEVNNPIAGISVKVTGFEKLGCIKANGRPGYSCDFLFETATQVRSNEGNEAGRKHAEAVQQLLGFFGSMSNAPSHTASSGRFLYVKGRNAWTMLKNE